MKESTSDPKRLERFDYATDIHDPNMLDALVEQALRATFADGVVTILMRKVPNTDGGVVCAVGHNMRDAQQVADVLWMTLEDLERHGIRPRKAVVEIPEPQGEA